MRTVRTAVLAGVAIAGLTGLALAAAPTLHEMTVQGPDGAVAHISYTGSVAPKVTFVQGPASPFAVSFWRAPSPFAELDRITALMDRQMAQMMYQARLMEQQATADPLSTAVFKDMPAGSSSYSFVSTASGNGYCMRTTQITSSPNGGKPKVVSSTSGNCGSASGSAAPAQVKAAAPVTGLQTITYKAAHPVAQTRHGI
jgi:hypothetical protein